MCLRRLCIPTVPYTNFCPSGFHQLTAQHIHSSFPSLYNYALNCHHIYDDTGKKLHIDALLKLEPTKWQPSVSNKLGCLAQGVRDVAGNDVVDYIKKSDIPRN